MEITDDYQTKVAARTGSITVLIGSILMILGAAFLGISGADLDASLSKNDLAEYLISAQENQFMLITNLSLWIMGVILLGIAGIMMAYLGKECTILSKLSSYNYCIAIPIVVIAYSAWLAIVVRLSAYDSEASTLLAEVLGWFASRANWIATILVLGTGPFFITLAGRKSWVPKWLQFWSYIALFTGLLNFIAMFADGLTTYGFLIIPVGMGWMVASFFVLIRLSQNKL